MNKYFCYIKRSWSKDFLRLKEELNTLSNIKFIVNEEDRFVIEFNESELENVESLLKLSVKTDCWHDIVDSKNVYVIFYNKIVIIPLKSDSENIDWLKMKELEASIRKYETIEQMINDSVYKKLNLI